MSDKKLIPTKGERLVIHRRRKDLNQVEAAAEFNIHVDKYRDWEADRKDDQPTVQLGELAVHEQCYLLRRRSGRKQREVAADLGVTRLWVIQMEDGTAPVDRLREYWGI